MDDSQVARETLELRLRELQQDYDVGERRLRSLDVEQARLRETLLRISGAMEVLRELLTPEPDGAQAASPDADTEPS